MCAWNGNWITHRTSCLFASRLNGLWNGWFSISGTFLRWRDALRWQWNWTLFHFVVAWRFWMSFLPCIRWRRLEWFRQNLHIYLWSSVMIDSFWLVSKVWRFNFNQIDDYSKCTVVLKKRNGKNTKVIYFMQKNNIVMNISDDFDDAFVTDRFRWLLVHVR